MARKAKQPSFDATSLAANSAVSEVAMPENASAGKSDNPFLGKLTESWNHLQNHGEIMTFVTDWFPVGEQKTIQVPVTRDGVKTKEDAQVWSNVETIRNMVRTGASYIAKRNQIPMGSVTRVEMRNDETEARVFYAAQPKRGYEKKANGSETVTETVSEEYADEYSQSA